MRQCDSAGLSYYIGSDLFVWKAEMSVQKHFRWKRSAETFAAFLCGRL